MQSERREIKVLHVDDEPDFLLITKHNLEKRYADFSIDTATSAEEGITLLKGGKYDVVVSDYQMPGMDGLEFLQNLRASGDKIPFIMFTGRGREEVAIEALNKGANHYLQKGGDITSLYQTLKYAIVELANRRRAEEKVAEVEKEQQIILDALPLNIFHINRNSKFVHANEVLAERYGLKPEDFKDKTSRDLFPDVGEAYIESDKAIFESGTRQIGTIRKIVTPQGEKWMRLDKVPLKDGEGNVTGIIGFELDITEQEQAEETLRESEKKLSQIVLGSPIPAFVIDHRHIITHWNTACEQLTGFSAAEMVGTKKQWLAFYPEERPVMADFVVDEQPEEVITSFYADKYQRSKLIEGAYEASDFFPSLEDGGKWLFFTAAPLRDSKGHSTGALETLQDVTGLKSAEEALRKSEERYRALVESTKDSVYLVDRDCRYLFMNEKHLSRIGLSKDMVIGKAYGKFHSKEDAEEFAKIVEEVFENGESVQHEHRSHREDNRYFLRTLSPVKDPEGRVTAVTVVSKDINERKQMENELQEREKEHQTVLDTVPVGIYHIDADSRFIHVNKALAERYGMTPEDFKGKTSRELFPDVGVEYLESDKEVLESGVPQRGVTSKLTTPEGEKWVRLDKVPLQDADGNITDIVGFELDITERIKTQEELRNAHKKMQDIVEFLPDATFVIDSDMKVIAWNRAIEEMTGIPKDDIIGKGDHEYALPFYGERRAILTDLVFSSGDEIESRYAHVGKKGNTLFAEIYSPFMYGGKGAYLWGIATPLYDPEGNVVGAIESVRDITERKQAEKERDGLLKELETKNREMGRFTYTVSHDLRSPLVTIQGFTTMLQKDIEQNERERAENDLKYIENAVTKMSALLSDTLELSRIGRIVNPPEDVPFGDIVHDALEQTAGDLNAHTIDISVAEDFPTVHVDRMRIVEVLVNLITNSIKYRGDQPQPKIEIGYRVDDKDTVFFVKDNGIGVDKSQHEKVFELFYGWKRAEKEQEPGLPL